MLLVKQIRDTMGTFHAKMDLMKDRHGTDLTEADVKKRWQEYTEELYKKDLQYSPSARHPGMWALGSITMNKASAGGQNSS